LEVLQGLGLLAKLLVEFMEAEEGLGLAGMGCSGPPLAALGHCTGGCAEVGTQHVCGVLGAAQLVCDFSHPEVKSLTPVIEGFGTAGAADGARELKGALFLAHAPAQADGGGGKTATLAV
jgi:hypothetical protein